MWREGEGLIEFFLGKAGLVDSGRLKEDLKY
jgi:hypothetical protein